MEFETPPALGPLYARALIDRRPASMPEGRSTPRLEARLAPLAVDGGRLARYREVCGFEAAATLPVTYPHVLAAGLQMHLLARPAFPVRVAGLVHIRHVIRQHRPLPVAASPVLKCWLEGSRPTAVGEEFCLHAVAELAGEACWEEETYFIARDGGRRRGARQKRPAQGFTTVAGWSAPADIGRRYARVSGDYNPIHLWPLTGRLFGFTGAIAHGMWSLARCAATLAPATDGACRLECRFLRPLVLPARVLLQRSDRTSPPGFRLVSPDEEQIFLSGAVGDP
jgi:hypothetical protein